MKMRIEKYRLWLSWLIYIFCFLIVYWRLSEHYYIMRDDVPFAGFANDYNLFDYLKLRYAGWSSRLIVEIFVYLFCYLPHIVWKIGMSLCFLGCGAGFCYLLNIRDIRHKILVLLAVLSLPNIYLSNSGWIVTTSFYILPLCCGIFSICSIRDSYDHKNISRIKGGLYLLATIIAANMEQYCFILGGIFVIALGYFYIYEKRFNSLILGQLCMVLFNVLMVIITPGNRIRYNFELKKYLPEYETWSIGKKIITSVTHFCDNMFFDYYLLGLMLIACFCVFKLAYHFYKKKRYLFTLGSAFLCCVAMGMIRYFYDIYPVGDNHLGIFYIFPLLLMSSLIGGVALLSKENKFFYVLAMILGIGFIACLLLGFSPTIYASNVRVFIGFLYILLFSVLYILVRYEDKIKYANVFVMIFVLFWLCHNMCSNNLL